MQRLETGVGRDIKGESRERVVRLTTPNGTSSQLLSYQLAQSSSLLAFRLKCSALRRIKYQVLTSR
jgi:hypothetical protein